jgi:hypothetical protein
VTSRAGAADCAEARELFPELAADVAAGDERARALTHLSGCADCRRELAQTTEIVDELLLLAPEHEPPPGFEHSVIASLTPPTPLRRLRAPLLWAASIVLVAGIAAGAVWWQTADDRRLASDYRHTLAVAHGRGLSAAPLLTADGAETGTLFAYEGSPPWLYVTFRSLPTPGHYDVQLFTTDGRSLTLRPFTATPRSFGWGSIIRVPVEQIERIEFIRSGSPILTARFG